MNTVLYNSDIIERHQHDKFWLMLSDFRGAAAYCIVSLGYTADYQPAIEAFSDFIKIRYFPSFIPVEFSYKHLSNIITESSLLSIPEVAKLNTLKPEFYDLHALAREIVFMICRQCITQPL